VFQLSANQRTGKRDKHFKNQVPTGKMIFKKKYYFNMKQKAKKISFYKTYKKAHTSPLKS